MKREKNPYKGLNKKKLNTALKRFLSSRKSDPDYVKYYQIKDDVDYFATTMGSAASVRLKNKYGHRDGTVKYIKPLAKGKQEVVDHIEDFKDIEGLFTETNFDEYEGVAIEEIDKWVAIHEVMTKTKPLKGDYGTANMDIHKGYIKLSLYDNEAELSWKYKTDSIVEMIGYKYDFSLMLNIMKLYKDFKIDKIHMYYKGIGHPIFFFSDAIGYKFETAINRKLVR